MVIAMTLLVPVLASAQDNACSTDHALYGTPGSYTFTVPAGVTQLRILSIGAGGGGGAGSGGWGSAGGGACGGALTGGTMTETPGQKIPLYVGYGGNGGNGSNQQNPGGCPWCGYFDPSSNGSMVEIPVSVLSSLKEGVGGARGITISIINIRAAQAEVPAAEVEATAGPDFMRLPGMAEPQAAKPIVRAPADIAPAAAGISTLPHM